LVSGCQKKKEKKRGISGNENGKYAYVQELIAHLSQELKIEIKASVIPVRIFQFISREISEWVVWGDNAYRSTCDLGVPCRYTTTRSALSKTPNDS
jgi:hypothetical protein